MERYEPETGTVLVTDGITARVITNKTKSCKECGKAQAGICGKQGAGMVMTVRNTLGAKQGDIVKLDIDRSTHIKAYLMIFVLPVLMLFIFSYAGVHLKVDGLDVVMGLTALAIFLLVSVYMIKRIDRNTTLYISSVMGRGDSVQYMTPEEWDYH